MNHLLQGFKMPLKSTIQRCLNAFCFGVFFSACTIKEPCDANQTVLYGQCQDPPPETDETDTSDEDGETSEGQGGMGGMESTPDPVDEAPNFGTTCDQQSECTGGTVCGAEGGLPMCIGLCGSGDPFESSCPQGTACTEAQPGTSACL
jgi:hypothetical protein